MSGEFFTRDLPSQYISRHHALRYAVRHFLEQFHDYLPALAETCQDEGTASVEVLQIVVEGPSGIVHRHRETLCYQLVASIRLHGYLAIERRVEIELVS